MEKQLIEKFDMIHSMIIENDFDEALIKLNEALDFYEENSLKIEIPNIFRVGNNFVGGFSDSEAVLTVLKRITNITSQNQLKCDLMYKRYSALAYAIFGLPDIALSIMNGIENDVEKDTINYVDLMNTKGIILSKLKRHEEAIDLYLENHALAVKLNYEKGQKYIVNLGYEYHYLKEYEKAIEYLKIGLQNFENKNEFQHIRTVIELSDVYFLVGNYDLSKRIINRVKNSELITQNRDVYHQYCSVMYKLNRYFGKFEEALYFHEILKDIEIQINMDFYTNIINHQEDNDHKSTDDYKGRNIELGVLSDKLKHTNDFLRTTLAKSHEMQQDLFAKNQELEATMESLNNTQDRLVLAEKRNVLDSMFINIANHMNTPLGVMNTATSHVKNISKKTQAKLDESKLSKSGLLHHFEELDKTIALYEESMNQVIAFVDTLKLYKTREEEEIIEVNIREYLETIAYKYKKFKGVDDVEVICHDDSNILINTGLLEKCIDLVSNKLLLNSSRNGFDIEVSNEASMISIGVGDFRSKQEPVKQAPEQSIVDSYDFYIIQTIVENLLNGRFIKFNDRGNDYFQFIFQVEN